MSKNWNALDLHNLCVHIGWYAISSLLDRSNLYLNVSHRIVPWIFWFGIISLRMFYEICKERQKNRESWKNTDWHFLQGRIVNNNTIPVGATSPPSSIIPPSPTPIHATVGGGALDVGRGSLQAENVRSGHYCNYLYSAFSFLLKTQCRGSFKFGEGYFAKLLTSRHAAPPLLKKYLINTIVWWPYLLHASTGEFAHRVPTQFLIHEEGGLERWFNLTIVNVGLESVADYTCVAVNAGGVMEENISLTFEEPEPVRC